MFQTKEISLFNYCSIKIDNKKKSFEENEQSLKLFYTYTATKKEKVGERNYYVSAR